MRLQTKLPAGMLQAVTQCQLCILFAFSAVHWLKKEVLKIELLVQFRACTVLRENKFEFVSGAKSEFRPRFWTNANPINSRTRHLCPICLDSNFEARLVERVD
jgi:hypothetical protein